MPDLVASRQLEGVCFPRGGDGQRSTQATGRAVFADCARAVDPALAARIEHTNDWRGGYLGPLRDIVIASSASQAEAMADPGPRKLGSVEVRGSRAAQPALSLPYRGRRLFGQDLQAEVDDWVARGIAEPGLASTVYAVLNDPEILDLRDVHVAVLGAGAEMGPARSLLRWGATGAHDHRHLRVRRRWTACPARRRR